MLHGLVAPDVEEQVAAGLQAGWAVTQEKALAGWVVLEEHARLGYLAAKVRMNTLLAGKALLDQGGPAMERAIRAKVAKREAAEQEDRLAHSLSLTVKTLEAAKDQLHAGHTLPEGLLDGVLDTQDPARLAEACEARLRTCKQLLGNLGAKPQAPAMSLAEQDAARILQLRESSRFVAALALENCEALKDRRSRSHPRSPALSPCSASPPTDAEEDSTPVRGSCCLLA